MQLSVELTNFTAGELSPRMKGRFDFKKYYDGCDSAMNMVVMPQGGATRRPGTLFVALSRGQAARNRLKDFIFSSQQPYVLEFSNGFVRIYRSDAVLESGGIPVDVAVPYQTADLPLLKFAQSADTLFIAHPNYPAAKLTRSSDTNWAYSPITFLDGPYLTENTDQTNLVTPSGATGAITLTWTNTKQINNGAGFGNADIGRYVRVKLFSLWACCLITGVNSPTQVQASVQGKVNNGCDGAIDGNAWAANTRYDKNACVKGPDGNPYIATTPGISGSLGPQSVGGQSVLDGTIIWASATAFQCGRYQQSTFYALGDIVCDGPAASKLYYQCTIAGKTFSGGALYPQTGANLGDGGGDARWCQIPVFKLPTSTLNWQLGAFSPGAGYPETVRFWQQRLFWGGFPAAPNQLFGSVTGDFLNHAPSMSDGTVLDSSALNWIIDDDKVQAILAMVGAGSAQAQQLAVLTAAGEQILQGASSSQALTPTSVQAYNETIYGAAANVTPLRIGKAVLFVDRTGRKMREWAFYWQMNGYNGPDLLQFSEHITRARDGSNPANNGIADMVYQQAPYQVIWAYSNDGQLLSFTYDRDQGVFAPMRHTLGGNYFGGSPIVESMAVIPSQDNTYDELWLSVLRTINGAVTRTMEVMTRYFDGAPQDFAFFADCALTSALTTPNATLTPSGFASQAPAGQINENANDPVPTPVYGGIGTLTASAAVFAPGDAAIDGNANPKIVRLNGGKLIVTQYISATQVQAQVLTPWQMLSLAPAGAGQWSATPKAQSFSGLGYLAGETVAILGDGAELGTGIVAGGSVTIANNGSASFACIGYAAPWWLVSMPFEPARAAAAAASGKIKNVSEMWVRLHESLGVFFGRRGRDPATDVFENKAEPIEETGVRLFDAAPVVYSGPRRLQPQGGYDREGQIYFYGTGMLPATILSVVANADVEEIAMPEAA